MFWDDRLHPEQGSMLRVWSVMEDFELRDALSSIFAIEARDV